MRFRADLDGYVTGVRFYKGPGNSGTHVGNLWAADGTRLAAATFTSESDSGWQQVSFPNPVAIPGTFAAMYFTFDVAQMSNPASAIEFAHDISTTGCGGPWRPLYRTPPRQGGRTSIQPPGNRPPKTWAIS